MTTWRVLQAPTTPPTRSSHASTRRAAGCRPLPSPGLCYPTHTSMSPASGRLQVAAIVRSDNGVIALPGGMVDAGEIVSATVRREFAEEVLNLPSEARAARVHTRSECTSTAATL